MQIKISLHYMHSMCFWGWGEEVRITEWSWKNTLPCHIDSNVYIK